MLKQQEKNFDLKEGYRRAAGPNSNPTLALTLTLALGLIKTEYWDRAGGGGNISYDW